jgi:hypothetical protein
MTMKGVRAVYDNLKPLIELCKIVAVLYLIFGVVFDVQNTFKGYKDTKDKSERDMNDIRQNVSLISKYVTTKENVDSMQNIRLSNIETGQKEIYDILKQRPMVRSRETVEIPRSPFGPSLTRERPE